MKKFFLIMLMTLSGCSLVQAQNLPPFETPEQAKDWLYTVKPTQLLDYLVWASKIENEKPLVTLPMMSFLAMQDRSMYVSYGTPLYIRLGGDLMTIEIRPENRIVPDFIPESKDVTWQEVFVGASLIGGGALVLGFLAGVVLVQ